jgi:predicted DNA-binding protein YlxM (UPF0122 family)
VFLTKIKELRKSISQYEKKIDLLDNKITARVLLCKNLKDAVNKRIDFIKQVREGSLGARDDQYSRCNDIIIPIIKNYSTIRTLEKELSVIPKTFNINFDIELKRSQIKELEDKISKLKQEYNSILDSIY